MDQGKERRTSLRDFLHVVFKRKNQIVFFFGACVITAAIGSFVVRPTYEASAQLLVKIGRENIYVPTLPTGGTPSPVTRFDPEEQINSEIEILTSRFLAEKVVEFLGPAVIYKDLNRKGFLSTVLRRADPQHPPLERAVFRLQKALTVGGVRRADVISVSFKHEDPEMAASVVNTLTRLYLDRHLEIHKSPQSHEFFKEQAATAKRKLKKSEEKLEAFKKEHEVSVLRALLNPQSSIATSLEEEESELLRQIGELQLRLVELELKEHELVTKYNDQIPLVQSAREETRLVRGRVAALQSRRSKLNEIEMELNRLQQDVEVDRQNYRLYLSKFEESRISEAMDKEKIANISLIEPAKPPLKPISPKIFLNMVLSVFLGGVGALGLAFFSEYLGDALDKAEDLGNHLELPVLASIPEYKALKKRKAKPFRGMSDVP